MSISKEIEAVIQSHLEDDQFLVDVVLKGAPGTQKLIVLVDSDSAMTIDTCAKLSRKLSVYLEENDKFDSAYTLEVSSPGLDHPLKLQRQYLKSIDRNVRVLTNDGIQIEGKLKKADKEKIEVEKYVKKGENETFQIPFENIEKTMVLVSFSKQG